MLTALLCLGLLLLGGPAPAAPRRGSVAAKKSGSRSVKRRHGGRVAAKLPPLRDGSGRSLELAAGSAAKASAPASKPPVGTPPQVQQPAGKSVAVTGKKPNGRLRGKAGPPTDDDLLEEAQAAYVRGERQRAIDLAQSVAEKGGTTAPAAWKFIGLAACSVRSQRMATRAYQNLQSQADQRAISDACKHNGLSYRDEHFVGE